MTFVCEVKNGMYLYRGPRGHSGIAYSIDTVRQRLDQRYGAGGYSLQVQ